MIEVTTVYSDQTTVEGASDTAYHEDSTYGTTCPDGSSPGSNLHHQVHISQVINDGHDVTADNIIIVDPSNPWNLFASPSAVAGTYIVTYQIGLPTETDFALSSLTN